MLVPRAIDEMPILAVAAACAEGPSIVRDAAEASRQGVGPDPCHRLQLGKMGVAIEERSDDSASPAGHRGGRRSRERGCRAGATIGCDGLVIAGLLADGPTVVEGIDCIATSYPDFLATCRAGGRGRRSGGGVRGNQRTAEPGTWS